VPEALPPAVLDDEPAAAEHLLRLPRVLVLVDGYNVTITARGTASLPDQRRWLVDATAEAAARTGAEFLVVFDGSADEHGPGDGPRRRGVQVRFTAAGVEADDEVLELLVASPAERPVVVVSDDRRVRGGARRLGANVVGVDQLVAALRR
jgi:predicted RNA-binding protein with PIN domain